jgi:hypothetical protein
LPQMCLSNNDFNVSNTALSIHWSPQSARYACCVTSV